LHLIFDSTIMTGVGIGVGWFFCKTLNCL
jgi:hypothetical protein